ncbi:MAG TPA: ATP-dependent DNA helicase, partial [Alphaproteobacteria bacterium]|nr:ATP-dependent DNA helicase [Alphaproteobacteria bacterium]
MTDIVCFSSPTLVAGFRRAALLALNGEVHEMGHAEAAEAIAALPSLIVCHGPATARRLGINPFSALDILELFAFVRPAKPSLPTVGGIADALGLTRPETLADAARLLARAAEELIAELDDIEQDQRSDAGLIAGAMASGGWGWGARVMSALGAAGEPANDASGLDVWRRLGEWSEHMPEPPPGNVPVAPAEARARLAELLGGGAEDRPQQADYASAVSAAFAPRDEHGKPNMVIAEAGTGVGKTIGYISAASLWAERNEGPVWISTYTRNLQRQIDTELDRLCPDPAVKARRVVIRKGRENYLCLLNMEDAIARIGARTDDARALGLLARWAANSRDGDMVGGDFPAWLADLLGHRNTLGLTDQRGECIYSSCRHYHKCFIERTVRRARRADIVVANHALVMTQAASGGLDDGFVPTRVIFDEGHHVFDAADSAFSAELGGIEGAELRRWLIGVQDGRRGRGRGLKRRIEDIAALDETTETRLNEVVEAAYALPAPGWCERLASGQPVGVAEVFLAGVRRQVYARARAPDSPYDLETETTPLGEGVLDAAEGLADALGRLIGPMRSLAERLMAQLDERASELDPPTRNRIEAVSRGLRRRVDGQVEAWRSMLEALRTGAPETFVDWFAVRRIDGRDIDVTMHRHWIDPTEPFAHTVAEPAHGIVITSATLRDCTGDEEADWQAAEQRTGAVHIEDGAMRAATPSPFDYLARTRVIVVTDVRKDDLGQVAAAYRELFVAAAGGALGLFTAISRLRRVHERIAPELEEAGLDLYAQHVDRLDITSLIEIFRAEEDSCLLGTDAVRDGVDVPGRSLRLIVFDRVPWPRPSILHRERRRVFSRTRYDDMITRLRLKQAYGRLVRRDTDAGVFVVLDPMMPSRLAGA